MDPADENWCPNIVAKSRVRSPELANSAVSMISRSSLVVHPLLLPVGLAFM